MLMKYKDIGMSVLNSSNQYEKERNIKTESIEYLAGDEKENWVIFRGKKSDGTNTLFLAVKNKNSPSNRWFWFCPSKEHVEEGFPKFIELYWINEEENRKNRQK